jgi:co-chaperonin GroES (HSP10)
VIELIDPINEVRKSEGGVYIPDIVEDPPAEGRVIMIGEGVEDEGISPDTALRIAKQIALYSESIALIDEIHLHQIKDIILHECRRPIPCEFEAGDKVLFTPWTGSTVVLEGREYFLINRCDVLAVCEEPTESTSPDAILVMT